MQEHFMQIAGHTKETTNIDIDNNDNDDDEDDNHKIDMARKYSLWDT